MLDGYAGWALRWRLLGGQRQHFFGMAAGGVGDGFAAEHAGDFFDAHGGVEHADFAEGLRAVAVFVHLPVVFAAAGHLRQVGDGQYLVLFAEPA